MIDPMVDPMIAAYRLQLTADFGFGAARALVPYLRRLGISHVYLSPITEARPGSTHGYDVVDHGRIREELGGAQGFQDLLTAVRAHGLKLILDIVPNHAGLGPKNAFWQDVLAYGATSPYACYFDIAWRPLKPELHNKVLLPFLGKNYGEALDGGELRVVYEDGRLFAAYFDHRFALSPRTYADVLTRVSRAQGADARLAALSEALAALAPNARTAAEVLVQRLADIPFTVPTLTTAQLHALLEKQCWRLGNWRGASFEINYRRFFDINDLIGLRMEDPHVFAATHRLVKELLADDVIAGVRIDHVDGLFDPKGYLERLQTLAPKPVWVEKILARDEALPTSWPVAGTTGYEFGAEVVSALTCPLGHKPLSRTYRRFVGRAVPFAEQARRSKRLMMTTKLAGELNRLAYELDRLSESNYHNRDFTLDSLRAALTEVIANFGRYRTYLPDDRDGAKQVIDAAVTQARVHQPLAEPRIFRFIGDMLLSPHAALDPKHAAWIGRFQQYTAPVTAKGIEDTTFYRYNCFVALNEVGADPQAFGMRAKDLHRQASLRATTWPKTMLGTSTHDSKRGEDLRMRLAVLSEIPKRWHRTVARLAKIARRHRTGRAPSRNDMYLFFQMLTALWHDRTADLAERLDAYMLKAAREAKQATSWVYPNATYEKALSDFVTGMVADPATHAAIATCAEGVAEYGFANSITQLVLKATSPGVPDFYRGTEFLDLSLVDPDNRRPVDFAARGRALEAVQGLVAQPRAAQVQELLGARSDHAKLFVTAALLALRRTHAALFDGTYTPLYARGARRAHAVAFAREHGGQALLVIVPRFMACLERAGGWGDTALVLPESLRSRRWTDVLTGEPIVAGARVALRELGLPWLVGFSDLGGSGA